MDAGVTVKQILVAVDEHPHAKQIVDTAIQLAGAMSAKILLIYVVTEKSVPARYVDAHGDKIPEHYFQDQFDRIASDLVKNIRRAGIEYEAIWEAGDPTKLILRTAKSKGVILIVIGIRGFRGLSRLKAIGNVPRNVIENSTVPVLAVP